MTDNELEKKAAEEMEQLNAAVVEEYLPRFVKECADRGLRFETEEDAIAAAETAALLKAAEMQNAEQGSPVKQANAILRQQLGL